MSKKIRQAVLSSRYYNSGDPFKASDIHNGLKINGKTLALNSIKKEISEMKTDGYVELIPRESHDESARYVRKHRPEEVSVSHSWRTRWDIPGCSPVWC